ncbi:MAG TPA: ATP-binding protein [Pseudolabrys sp.]|jgi:serine/threonine-protein kinase RsbW
MGSSGAEKNATLSIGNAMAELQRVVAFVEKFGVDNDILQDATNALNVSLDELLNNTISYGYKDELQHSITIRLSLAGGWLIAEIRDDGKPFDPREIGSEPIEGSLRMRKVGGLGLRFVKALMDGVDYERRGQYNIVKIKKKLAGGT